MRKTCVIVIHEEAIFKEIQERKPASIAINGPDGMLPAVQTTASNITKKFGIPTYVLADTTWGSCDLNSNGAKVLGADVLFNVGHTIGVPMWDKQVVMVDAFDDVSSLFYAGFASHLHLNPKVSKTALYGCEFYVCKSISCR